MGCLNDVEKCCITYLGMKGTHEVKNDLRKRVRNVS